MKNVYMLNPAKIEEFASIIPANEELADLLGDVEFTIDEMIGGADRLVLQITTENGEVITLDDLNSDVVCLFDYNDFNQEFIVKV